MASVPRDTVIDVDVNNIQTSTTPLASDNDANSTASSSSTSSRNSSPQPPSSVTSVSVHFDHSLPGTSSALPPECNVFNHLHPVTCNNDQTNDLTIVHHYDDDHHKVLTLFFVLVPVW